MSIGINNIEQSTSFGFSPAIVPGIGMERLFTSMLGYGKIVMLLLDLILLNICFFVSGWLLLDKEMIFSDTYLSGMIYASLLWVFLSYLRGIYKDLLLIDTVDIFRTLAKVFFIFGICSWFFILILLDGFNNISLFFYFVCLFYTCYGGTLAINRLTLLSIRKNFKDKIRKKKNIFIIGDSSSCELLESYIEENQCDLRLCGFFYDGYGKPGDVEQNGDETNKTKETAVEVNATRPFDNPEANPVVNPADNPFQNISELKGDTYVDTPEYGAEFSVFNAGGTVPRQYADSESSVSGVAIGVEARVDAGRKIGEEALLSNSPYGSAGKVPATSVEAGRLTEDFLPTGQLISAQKNAFNTTAWNKVIRGPILDCVKYFGKMQIDEIYCSMQNMEEKIARYLIKQADSHMIRIKFLPDFYQVLRRRSTINYMGTVPILSIRQEPLTVDSNLIIKRVFDFIFSLFVIVFILSWLIPIIGLLIKLESKGPIFFKQDRSGINNKPFKVYKFRSMRTVKGVGEDCQAVKDDIRLTKLGGLLRRTSLDELPQFVNVLLGNMTVVGPRPHMLSHTDKFSKEVDTYMVRHFAKPGITGWAQVNGCRGETRTVEAIEERVLHDVWYIENWSLTLDLKIIFLTVWNILRGEDNAY